MESLTNDEFGRLEAYDQVMPLDHSARMLGLLTFMVGSYLEFNTGEDVTLREICMPWLPEYKEQMHTVPKEVAPLIRE